MSKTPAVKIVIDVRDGLVDNVTANVPFEYVVCDSDTDGAFWEDLQER